MNALKLYRDLKARDVYLEVEGVNLKVDAPVGVLTDEDRASLLEAKPVLLEFLSRTEQPMSVDEDAPRSKARWAGPGWIRIFDPDVGLWHEVKASECLPGVIAEANAISKQRKGSGS